ncbi:transposase [Candidatus Peregrinibacteria bacterium]|nr:MAG: transposase [Candidatus Peregrinibacteria bacterium]
MFSYHRNSQKRIYDPKGMYFVTVVTHGRFPFFKERVFCELMIEQIRLSKAIHGFQLFAWVIMHDHLHLLIQPTVGSNISRVMFSLKKQFSHDVNRIIGENETYYTKVGAQTFARLLGGRDQSLQKYINNHQIIVDDLKFKFSQKTKRKTIDIPQFRWQKSYHDHLIRGENDLKNHIAYILKNPHAANYKDDWPYIHINARFIDLTDPIDL